MGNKNKKKPQTGGLQPKGGAYAAKDAQIAAQGGVVPVDPMVANSLLKEKAKEDKKKAKEKAKKERKERRKNRRTIITRIKDTGAELKKVRWPGIRHAMKQTGVVLAVVVIFGIIILAMDMVLGELHKLLVVSNNQGIDTVPLIIGSIILFLVAVGLLSLLVMKIKKSRS